MQEEEVEEEEGAKQVKISIKEAEEGMDRKRGTSGKCWHMAEGYRKEEGEPSGGKIEVHKGQRLSIQGREGSIRLCPEV